MKKPAPLFAPPDYSEFEHVVSIAPMIAGDLAHGYVTTHVHGVLSVIAEHYPEYIGGICVVDRCAREPYGVASVTDAYGTEVSVSFVCPSELRPLNRRFPEAVWDILDEPTTCGTPSVVVLHIDRHGEATYVAVPIDMIDLEEIRASAAS